MKNIYVCAAWRDPNSILQFKQICNKIISMGHNPICWQVMYAPLLDFADHKNREKASTMGLSLMLACDEIWVFGAKTTNMTEEVLAANKHEIFLVEHSLLDFLHNSR
jgi:hypothetical protein